MRHLDNKQEEMSPVDEGRRSLTKAGLAIPAILGTLASKPVLAAAVPWKCTISGQVSGNVSGHETETCTTVGSSRTTLYDTYRTSANENTNLSALFPGLTIYFYWDANALTTDSSKTEAKIFQILNSANTAPSGLDFAQKAVVLLLNAKYNTDTSLYPLTEFQAKKLYVAAATGGTFSDTNPDVNWNNDMVNYYINLLYH